MVAVIINCGTFIGNPDRIGPGTDTKDKRVESSPNESNGDIETSDNKEVHQDEVFHDETDDLESVMGQENLGMPERASTEEARITKKAPDFISTIESNRQTLPLEVSTNSVKELRGAIANNEPLPSIASEDFVDYFSDFPKESFAETFMVSYNLTESLWNTETYLLSIVIDSNDIMGDSILNVKSFIEFNPSVVSKFKLIGYQNEKGRILDDTLSLSQFTGGSRKVIAFEISLQSASNATDASLFSLNLSYLKPDSTGKLMENSATISHNLSRLNISNQGQTLLNACVAFTAIVNKEAMERPISVNDIKSYLENNRSIEPGSKWLEFEDLINSFQTSP